MTYVPRCLPLRCIRKLRFYGFYRSAVFTRRRFGGVKSLVTLFGRSAILRFLVVCITSPSCHWFYSTPSTVPTYGCRCRAALRALPFTWSAASSCSCAVIYSPYVGLLVLPFCRALCVRGVDFVAADLVWRSLPPFGGLGVRSFAVAFGSAPRRATLYQRCTPSRTAIARTPRTLVSGLDLPFLPLPLHRAALLHRIVLLHRCMPRRCGRFVCAAHTAALYAAAPCSAFIAIASRACRLVGSVPWFSLPRWIHSFCKFYWFRFLPACGSTRSPAAARCLWFLLPVGTVSYFC